MLKKFNTVAEELVLSEWQNISYTNISYVAI